MLSDFMFSSAAYHEHHPEKNTHLLSAMRAEGIVRPYYKSLLLRFTRKWIWGYIFNTISRNATSDIANRLIWL